MDPDGWVTMRGRLSERLTVAGEHWYPRDVEEALMSHDAVREAALIGLPDEVLGHRPVAFVTLHVELAEDELLAHAAAVTRRSLDEVEVVVADALPMTPTGKISKAQLLSRATS
jgi:acyl-CoA synthetase (AMP-forming)/AMP-acid ligase II